MQQHLRLLITEKIQSVAKNLEAQKEAWLKKNVSQPTQLICIFNLFHLSYSFGVHECSAALAHLNWKWQNSIFPFQKILFVWFISESNTAEYLTKKKTPSLVKAGLNLEKKENLSFCVFTDVSLEIWIDWNGVHSFQSEKPN